MSIGRVNFGCEKEAFLEALRALEVRVKSGEIIPQQLNRKSIRTIDDFEMHEISFVFAEFAEMPENNQQKKVSESA